MRKGRKPERGALISRFSLRATGTQSSLGLWATAFSKAQRCPAPGDNRERAASWAISSEYRSKPQRAYRTGPAEGDVGRVPAASAATIHSPSFAMFQAQKQLVAGSQSQHRGKNLIPVRQQP